MKDARWRWIATAACCVLIAVSAWTLGSYFLGSSGASEDLFTTVAPAESDASSGVTATGNLVPEQEDDTADQSDGAAGEDTGSSDGPTPPLAAADSAYATQSGDPQSSNSSSRSSDSPAATGGSSASSATASGSSSSSSSSGDQSTHIQVNITVDGTAAGSNISSALLSIPAGSTVYDALKATGASVNARSTVYGMYVAGINGLAEKEYGAQSGWTYYVNGQFADRACDCWRLSEGDYVKWVYVSDN